MSFVFTDNVIISITILASLQFHFLHEKDNQSNFRISSVLALMSV